MTEVQEPADTEPADTEPADREPADREPADTPLTNIRKRRARLAAAVGLALLVLIAGIVIYTVTRPNSSSTTAVATSTVAKKTLHITVSGTGSTVIAESEDVYPAVSGTVKQVYVSLNETVTAGERLYSIDTEDIESSILQANTSLLQAKQSKVQSAQSYTKAQRELDRAEDSLSTAEEDLEDLRSLPATTPGISIKIAQAENKVSGAETSVDDAESSVDSAYLGLRVAKASLASSQEDYDDAVDERNHTIVRAPIRGVVTNLPVSVGSAVTAGTGGSATGSASGTGSSASSGGSTGSSSAGASSGSGTSSTSSGSTGSSGSSSSSSSSSGAVTVSDLSDLEVQISVSEVDVPKVKVGQKATVTFDALPNKKYKGTVSSIAHSGTSSSGVVDYEVELTLKRHDSKLKPDMTASADIETQVVSDAIVVPSAAVETSGAAKYVQVLGKGGLVKRQVVTLGASDDTYTQITTGLKEGAKIANGNTTGSSSSSGGRSDSQGGGFPMGGGPPDGGPGGN